MNHRQTVGAAAQYRHIGKNIVTKIHHRELGGVFQSLQRTDLVAAEAQFFQIDQGFQQSGIPQTDSVCPECYQFGKVSKPIETANSGVADIQRIQSAGTHIQIR